MKEFSLPKIYSKQETNGSEGPTLLEFLYEERCSRDEEERLRRHDVAGFTVSVDDDDDCRPLAGFSCVNMSSPVQLIAPPMLVVVGVRC